MNNDKPKPRNNTNENNVMIHKYKKFASSPPAIVKHSVVIEWKQI